MSRPSRPTTTTESRARDRSRSPRAVHLRTLHVENLKASQGENANDVYFAQLTKRGKKRDKEYDPAFTFVDGSKKANRIKGDQWNDTMFEMSVDVYDDDINFINSPMPTSQDLQDHLAFMLADNRRKTEVSIRNLNAEERKLMEAAKDKEVDQWISNSVFKKVRRAGIPIKRIMAMRWILTWKEAPEGTKAKARRVAKRIH